VSTTSHRKFRFILPIIVTLVLCARPAWSDVELDLQSHSERVEIVGRVATTTVSQTYVNYTRRRQEVVVRFRLPPGGAVDDLAMWVGGLRSPGVLHPRIAARQIYREIRNDRRDPAILEYLGGGQWQLSVFPIMSNKTQKVEFKFTSILSARGGRCIYNGMSVLGGTFSKAVAFEFASTLRGRGISDVKAVSDALGAQRVRDRVELGFRAANRNLDKPVVFSFTPGVKPSKVVAFKSKNGRKYFAAVLDPPWKPKAAKPVERNAVIVLDASASMKGESFKIAARAVQAILDDLTARDKFGVVVAGSDVEVFHEKLLPATKDSKLKVFKWLAGFLPKGATDLAAALRAVESFNKDTASPLNVFLIGDGDDCVGARSQKKDVSPFAVTPKGESPSRPPANCRFFACQVYDSSFVLEYLAESTGGMNAYIDDGPGSVAAMMKPILKASKIADPTTQVTVRQIAAGGAKPPSGDGAMTDIGFSRPDERDGIVISGQWPGAGKRTLEVTLRRGRQAQSTRYELDFPKGPAADEPGTVDIRKIWAHQRADRMWAKLLRKDVKIGEVKALMDFSRSEAIVTRVMALLVLESDKDYIDRGIKRPGSSIPIDTNLSQRSVGRLLAEAVTAARGRTMELDSEAWENSAIIQHQARELMRRNQIAAAARLYETAVRSKPGQFEARRQASLISEYLALKKSFGVSDMVRESHDDVLRAILAGAKWHEMVMQTEPTALVLRPETAKTGPPQPPPTPVLAGKIPLTPEELQADKLLSRKIPKIDMKDAGLKDVLAFLDAGKGDIAIRWDRLVKQGIKPSTTVSVQLRNVTLEKALQTVLGRASAKSTARNDDWLRGLDFTVDNSTITVSSKRDLSPNTYLRSYDIQDMLAFFSEWDKGYYRAAAPAPSGQRELRRASPEGVFFMQAGDNSSGPGRNVTLATGTFATLARGPVTFDLAREKDWDEDREVGRDDIWDTGIFDPGAGGGDSGIDSELRSTSEHIASIKVLLAETVDPFSWRDAGGELGAITNMSGVFMIRQTRANHKAIIKLLDTLRDKWRKHYPGRIAYTWDAEQSVRARMRPEAPFTPDGRITEWLRELSIKAGAGKLSKFSSIRVERIGSRKFARICGVWFDTSLTRLCRIYAVARDSEAHAALLNTDAPIKKWLALGRYVIIRADDTSAFYLNPDGISEADDKRLKKLIEAITKPAAKR